MLALVAPAGNDSDVEDMLVSVVGSGLLVEAVEDPEPVDDS